MTLYVCTLTAVSSFFALAWSTIVWLKLVSYMQVNWWCRNSPQEKNKGMNLIRRSTLLLFE